MIEFLKKNNSESKYLGLIDDVTSGKNCSCFGLNFSEIAFLATLISKQKIIVVNSVLDAYKYCDELRSCNLRCEILVSKIENYLYSYFSDNEDMKNLTNILFKIANNELDCLVVLNKVLTQKVVNKNCFLENILSIKKGERLDFDNLKQNLIKAGFKKVDEVLTSGEFNFVGDCVTIFSINYDYPIKISFFDDEVEAISLFSLENYQKICEKDEVKICPQNFYFYDDSLEEKIFKRIDEAVRIEKSGQAKDNLISVKNEIENRQTKDIPSQFVLPFLENFNCSILDYFSQAVVIFVEPKMIVDAINDEYVNFLSETNSLICEGRLLSEHKNCLVNKNDVFKTNLTKLAFLNINTSNKIFESQKVYSFLSSFVKNYNNNLNFLFDDVASKLKNGGTVICCVSEKVKAEKLSEFFLSKNLENVIIENENNLEKGKLNIFVSQILFGVDLIEDKILLLANFNIYGQKKVDDNSNKIHKVFFTPNVGDFVVHETFGICKCVKIEKVSFSGFEKDYIVLQFSDNDMLYLPNEKTNLISKYVGTSESPKLNKLGSNEFAKEKQKVKTKVKELAFNLQELYAKRKLLKGFRFCEDDIVQKEFEDAFPYDLTSDQEKAILDIKSDMQSDKVMDRLVCGDVGYGKTEVALRAIFKAVLSGKQVAFLCPTTILSEQHYKTCLARMKDFMVNVVSLNRFKSAKETKQILAGLSSGEINVVCGTHRLLSADVKFKDLGLLVLDEEQRFGVSDKEKIKNLRQNIDVLTLSATPIPRTLNMSLIGVRDISLIDTPPKNRLPIQTVVVEYSPSLLRQAITRELNRGGQTLIVFNRVDKIAAFTKTVRDMFPQKVVEFCHGQMDKKQLNNIIDRVFREEVDVLISTVLIENGIDLPLLNTIFVVDAENLGLSQLYQLRGRVGRSGISAYAYFTYPSNKSLTEISYKRLNSLSEFSGLGSGFKIAMKDLEIRGAGSIFGSEQSGHAEKVGIDMYNRLLKEAIEEIKGQKSSAKNDCKISVKLNCFIPKDYVSSEETRLNLYSEISVIKNLAEQTEMLKKLENNFGEIPKSVENLINVALLKNLLVEVNAKHFESSFDRCYIEFYSTEDVKTQKMLNILSKNKQFLSLNLKTLPIIELTDKVDEQTNIKRLINIFIND